LSAAGRIVDEVAAALRGWREAAELIGLGPLEIQRMESVFLQA